MVSASPPLDDARPLQPHQAMNPNDAATTTSNNNNNNSSNINTNTSNANAKRKPSRRANTAERRATHNAVERARRETLNGRFLDLAKLLPNLSQIRRPSKSAIVNSSIAYINASKHHRSLAQRELRALKNEADALRREINEWRDRASIPRLEEPPRGEGFTSILSGELEVQSVPAGAEDDLEEDNDLYPEGVDSQPSGPFYHEPAELTTSQSVFPHHAPPTPPVSSHGRPAGMISFNPMVHRSSMQAMQQGPPMVVTSGQVHFDPAHPQNMHGMPQFSHATHAQHAVHFEQEAKNWPMQYQHHHSHNVGAGPFAHHPWHDLMPGAGSTSEMSDSASASSTGGRARSGSISTNGGSFGSPPRSPGSFELAGYDASSYEAPSTTGSDFSVPRGLSLNTSAAATPGLLGPMVSSPITTAPAAGNGLGNVMVMGMM